MVAPSKKVKLDKIDRKIINDLQQDGRMTNVELANNAGISAPPCLRRVRALEDTGIIKGYFARTSYKKLGYGVTAFVTIRIKDQNDDRLAEFEQAITDWENVREAYMISGDYDFLLQIVAKDWEEYEYFVSDKITKIPNVESVKSSIRVKTTKYQPGVPIDLD